MWRASAIRWVLLALVLSMEAFPAAATGDGQHPTASLLAPVDFQVMTGSPQLVVRWQENRGVGAPKGHVLTLARPGEGNQSLIVRRRMAVGETGYPCDGTGLCSLTVSFPITMPAGSLTPDGRYALSIVSIFVDGHRSDGRCDDGTALGTTTACTSLISHPPGWASAEFLFSEYPWPQRFQDPMTRDVLLLDPADARAELHVWRPADPTQELYAARDTRWPTTGSAGSFWWFPPDARSGFSGWYGSGGASAILLRPPTRNVPLINHPFPVIPRQVDLPVDVHHPRLFAGAAV